MTQSHKRSLPPTRPDSSPPLADASLHLLNHDGLKVYAES